MVETVGLFFCPVVPRLKARFRISINDHRTGRTLKIELIEQPWPGRFWIRQHGRRPSLLSEGSLSVVFARLRRWVVKRAGR